MTDIEKRLITKVQYNNFEPGEFIKEQRRTYPETISLIESYPWEKQREGIHIDLTCSSITLQAGIATYLKLSLYYNRKFVLYYFDGETLYSKSLVQLTDSYQYIEDYFKTETINNSLFKKENTIFKSLSKHFVTNDFVYKVEAKGVWPYIDWFSKIMLLVYILVVLFAIFKSNPVNNPIITTIVLFLFLLVSGGINVWLSINYYNHSKGKFLQLSQGSETFSFGTVESFKKYNKADINQITIESPNSSKAPWNHFNLTIIYFNNGSNIKITSIMLAGLDIKRKLPGVPVVEKSVFIPLYS